MADIPGLNADVYFGDPEKDSLPDWREEEPASDDDEISDDERAALVEQLGFDPAEFEDSDEEPAPQGETQ